ncbi:TPA: RNA-binding protein [bacterium]|nr:RNA-binding protein [bacterium]
MKELVEYLAKNLVNNPDEVEIKEIECEKRIILQLKVAPSDVGKIIGRGGKRVKAIRTLLSATAAKISKRAALDVLD